jgi:hypothetical protein
LKPYSSIFSEWTTSLFYTCLVLFLEIFLESFASPPAPRKQKPRGDDVDKHPAFHFISLLPSRSFMSPSNIRALPVEQHSSKSTATFTEEKMDEFP